MSFAFKKFTFFQHTEVQGHAYPRNATCCAPSPVCLHVGCDNGSVHLLDSSFQLLATFQAYGYKVHEALWLEVRRGEGARGEAVCRGQSWVRVHCKLASQSFRDVPRHHDPAQR